MMMMIDDDDDDDDDDPRLPVIFLKDVSSRDFERLLCYMYRGEVSIADLEASLVFCLHLISTSFFCHFLPSVSVHAGECSPV